MAKLTNFAFCENDTNFQTNTGLFQPLDIVEVSENDFSLQIVFTVTDYSIKDEHVCRIVVKDAQNIPFFDTENFPVQKDYDSTEMDDIEGIITGFTLGVNFNNLPFRGPGLYSVDVLFDNDILNTFFIPVTFNKEGE